MLQLIRDTNGDALGVLLFLLLIIYFSSIDNRTWFETFLLGSSLIGFLVDTHIVWDYLQKH